jgi:hypothetical protein
LVRKEKRARGRRSKAKQIENQGSYRCVGCDDDELSLALAKSLHGGLVAEAGINVTGSKKGHSARSAHLNLPDFMTRASLELTPSRFFFCSHTI